VCHPHIGRLPLAEAPGLSLGKELGGEYPLHAAFFYLSKKSPVVIFARSTGGKTTSSESYLLGIFTLLTDLALQNWLQCY
jgi:hypothetical protein